MVAGGALKVFDPDFDVDYELSKRYRPSLKELLDLDKYKNLRMVKVRKQHNCKICHGLIKQGEECLTINNKGEGRQWICKNCLENM